MRAFTLVEILVSMVVLLVLLGMIFSITTTTGRTVGRVSAAIDAFTAGRATFDLVTQRLSQSTLNTYYDYFDASGLTLHNPPYSTSTAIFVPNHYGRQSDLQFLITANLQNAAYGQAVYFVSPQAYSNRTNQLATQGMLNACAFYVQYGSDALFSPGYGGSGGSGGALAPAPRYRYRLMQALEPTESLEVFYSVADATVTGTTITQNTNWINNLKYSSSAKAMSQYVAPLADNVIALIIWPRLSEDDDPTGLALLTASTYSYAYNSRPTTVSATQAATDNQLPPDVYVTMVTISEAAAQRLQTPNGSAPTIIETALNGRFASASNYQSDLNGLTSALIANHIDYRVFTTMVAMRDSRWSSTK